MPGTINDFKSSFTKDLARANRFDVNIPIPLTLIPYIKSARNLVYRCENANLPGRSLMTLEQKIGSNPVEKYPYLTGYSDIDLTFIVDGDMQQKIFLDAWMNFINPTYNYNFRYKSDYTTTMQINQYDVENKVSYSINLFDAFPISMNQLDLDWSSDNPHKLSITFAYTRWSNNSLQSFGMELVDAGLANFSDVVGGLGGNAQSAASSAGQSIVNNIQRSIFK
jgi:hypothetical protein